MVVWVVKRVFQGLDVWELDMDELDFWFKGVQEIYTMEAKMRIPIIG